MRTIRNDTAPALDNSLASDNSLRFVLSASDKDTIVSIGLPAEATLEDVARMLSTYPRWRYGKPVSICIIFNSAPHAAALR